MVLIVDFSVVLQKPGKSTPRLFLKQGTVFFDNIPFSLEEVRILDCQYGELYFKRERMGAKHCNFKAPERLVVRPRLESNAIPHIQTMHCLTNQHDITAGKENTKSSCKALESGEPAPPPASNGYADADRRF